MALPAMVWPQATDMNFEQAHYRISGAPTIDFLLEITKKKKS
jgi:hypothetical protein